MVIFSQTFSWMIMFVFQFKMFVSQFKILLHFDANGSVDCSPPFVRLITGKPLIESIKHFIDSSILPSPLWVMHAKHYNDVIMGAIASHITSLTIDYSTVYSDADQRKHQSSSSLAFMRGIHWGPVNSQHKWSITRKMFPVDDVIMRRDISMHEWNGSSLV